MDKKSTVLLTVIAVATLLVAVVGSTFAFFAIQETNNSNIPVTTTTASGSDKFSAVSESEIGLTVTNADMLKDTDQVTNTSTTEPAVKDEDNTITLSLQAGSGTATCSYNLKWEETSTYKYAISPTAVGKEADGSDYKEFTLLATADNGESIAEVNIDKIASSGYLNGEEKLEITHTFDKEATTQTPTQIIWTIKANFYNLPVDQAQQMGKTYTGNISVTDVVCENANASN